MMIHCTSPSHWVDYELIDVGNFEKLERFGLYVTARPEPQAVWDKSLSDAEWQKLAHATFKRDKTNPEKGDWILKPNMPSQWFINYKHEDLALRFRLGLSAFKHVGIFPEQSDNWDYIFAKCKAINQPKVLNLFAYTGGASLAARAAGASVTHVDSVKQVISWSRENMEASKLDNIRWVVEDALKFVQREVKRGNTYHGIIMDPPAYGRGPDGEKWELEENINEMLKLSKQLLQPQNHFFVINLYSMGFSALILDTLINQIFGQVDNKELGELYIKDRFDKKLPLGIYLRFAS